MSTVHYHRAAVLLIAMLAWLSSAPRTTAKDSSPRISFSEPKTIGFWNRKRVVVTIRLVLGHDGGVAGIGAEVRNKCWFTPVRLSRRTDRIAPDALFMAFPKRPPLPPYPPSPAYVDVEPQYLKKVTGTLPAGETLRQEKMPESHWLAPGEKLHVYVAARRFVPLFPVNYRKENVDVNVAMGDPQGPRHKTSHVIQEGVIFEAQKITGKSLRVDVDEAYSAVLKKFNEHSRKSPR